ncbi:hypothetical protein BLNAU_7840 [Blattamonas nauphoetae]|uniref:Uncharacterized protein n=1 Tax=Blattamonas nauphoetae TaxID=2049346 RepID=A0ABQ9Y0I5_9EUKA|nr:hypothetical protein BLNAU_7840 [Blattamonas nauphoetae]
MESSCPQPSPAASDFSLDDLFQLMEKLKGYDPENGERNEQLDEDRKRLDEMFHRLQHDKAKHDQIFKELDERNRQLDEKKKQRQRERAYERNRNINTCIDDSQSHTVTLIKSILRKYSPNWTARLNNPNSTFSLLADGHILFSKNTLKNRQQILSTPLLFRPVFNAILCPLLKLILQNFATKQRPSHPGALFFISGDHGVGKTSLMFILMSILSDLSIGFDYRIVNTYGRTEHFEIKIGTDGEVTFSPVLGGYSHHQDVYIHIHDDSHPEYFEYNSLYLIFTSPDQKRLQRPQPPSNSRYYPYRHQRHEISPNHLCYTFRLPTFSLAEDAAVMVGCTPTVPFALLSPEDMELRKEEQQILLSIEKDKVERAGKVPFLRTDVPVTSQQESAKTLLKAIAKYRGDFMFGLNAFLFNFMKDVVTVTEHNPNNGCMTLFLNDVVQMHTVSDASTENDTPTSKPHRLNWGTAMQMLRDNLQPVDDGLGNVTTPNFSEMTNTSESIVSLIKWHVGRETDIDAFHMSLCRTILESRNLRTEQERICVIVDWLIDQLDVHSESGDGQTSFVKYLLHEVVLSEWNGPPRQSKSYWKVSSKRRRSLKLNTAKTASLFSLAKTAEPLHFNIRSEIQRLSASIRKANLTGPPSTPASSTSTDSPISQIVRVKKHFTEPNLHEVALCRKVREEANDIWKKQGLPSKELRRRLMDALIDNLVTPRSYDSHQHTLPSLFVQSDSLDCTSTKLRNCLACLLTKSNEKASSEAQLQFIVDELLLYLLYSQSYESCPISATSNWNFDESEMARLACDLLTTIVDLQHESVEARLESVKKEIEDVRDRLSFMFLMDHFCFIAQDMNILVTPHSILKGLSERPERPPALGLTEESMGVFYRNVRDAGLSVWVQTATETLLELIDTPETDCVKDTEESPTKKMQLEERVVDTVTSSILKNVNGVIKEFFAAHENGHNPVENTKWLAIVRSMMNTLLFLIDAGMSRREIMSRCERLGELLEAVYEGHKTHLSSVAEYSMHRADRAVLHVLDDEGDDVENAADYVNDLTIFSTHFSANECRPTDGKNSEGAKPDFDVESLRTLELPRTLQIGSTSQIRLERMSIALFARNVLWFLEMEEDLPFDDECYVRQFFTAFLQNLNPGDVVHRSFVDFMNMTSLLSLRNFGLKREEFLWRLTNEEAALESGTFTLQKMRESLSLLSTNDFVTFSTRDDLLMSTDLLAKYHQLEVKNQPFLSLMTRQFGVSILLWASTELLFKAAKDTASHDSETEKTASSLNVARASIFGPSPRWLTSTDSRTNRGLSFLWDGVLKSEDYYALMQSPDSTHSQMMSFNTERILFEITLNAAWDDMTALVPVLPDWKKENGPHPHLNAVYSLMGIKTKAAMEKVKSQISFVGVSPFVELIMQSEVISGIARMTIRAQYNQFREVQTAKHRYNLPDCLEVPQVFISFLLNFPTPIKLKSWSTSFHRELVHSNEEKHFSSYSPVLATYSKTIGSMPMLAFPKLSNRSVHGTPFPQALSETKRGEADFYFADVLQKTRFGSSSGFDGLIVWRGSDRTYETIFMPIQATKSIDRSEMEDGMILIQKLLFQVMCHLEPSERIVALFNSPTKPKLRHFLIDEETTLPWQTGILGFHMVSSFLKFEENALKHMPSILRHRDHPLVSTRTSSHSTMTTQDITDTLLANVGHYPTFSTEFDPWTTTLSSVNDLTDRYLTLPFRWKGLYDLFWKPSTDGSTCETNPSQITEDEKDAKDWLDRMVRVTMQELNRIGVSPADLGGTEAERVNAFSSFVLSTSISCRRNELLDPTSMSTTSAIETRFVKLIQSIVGPLDSETLKCLPTSITDQESPSIDTVREARLRALDKLCRHPCIEERLHTVTCVMSNHAMKRIRNPAQECLSVLQSEKDGGMFRVPARNNLSSILHCGTVLLDNITPLPHIDTSQTLNRDLPQCDPRSVTLSPSADQLSTPPPHSPIASEPPPRSKTLRIPLHSFVLAKYGFSDSIPALCELTQGQLRQHVTNVTPAPLSRWHPRRVVIDPSLFPQHIPQVESLSLYTSFVHRLFDNAFIAVTTSLSTEIADLPLDEPFLLSQIRTAEPVQPNPTLFFVKSGSDFFTSPNTFCLDGVDTTTKSGAFPIAFSTGYKETDLREEMKQVFEPLTRLLPDHFPTRRPSLVHVDTEGKQELRKTSSSKKETEDRARGIVDSAILRMGATSTTPLFVFVVEEDLGDHLSLPISLLSSDGSVGCGMMRQRGLAEVLWILFLTRISREVMALQLNISIGSSDFSNSVIPFLYNSLVDAELLKHGFYASSVPSVINSLIIQIANQHLEDPNKIPSVGLELLVSAFPHLKDETDILLLSHLLMVCPSGRKGKSQLDVLVDHPSPKIGLVALIRWFQLLSSFAKNSTLEDAIESNCFTLAKVETLLLRAFYQIIELDGPDDLITQLYEAIDLIMTLEGEPLFFKTAQQQTLDELKLVADTRCETHAKDSPRGKVLFDVAQWIARHLHLPPPTE